MTTAPTIGIHPNIPDAVYRAWPCCNISSLVNILPHNGTPADYLYWLDHPKKTKPLRLGVAAHMATLQPELFNATYIVGPEVRGNTKVWKEADGVALANGQTMVKPDDYNRAMLIAGAVRTHSDTADYLTSGAAEVSFVWVDEKTGLMCKGRVDWLTGFIVVDLKTARDISNKGLRDAVAQYDLAARAAFYLDGLKLADKHGDTYGPFYHVFVRNQDNSLVRLEELGDEDLSLGRRMYRNALDRVAKCKKTGVWHGYKKGIVRLTAPDWYFKKINAYLPEE